MEVAAKANLLDLKFVRAKDLGRATHAIVAWIVETMDEVRVKTDFRREKLGVPHRVFVAWGTVEPGPVSVGKRRCRFRLLRLGLIACLGRHRLCTGGQRDILYSRLCLLAGGFRCSSGLSLELRLKLLDSSSHLLQLFQQLCIRAVVYVSCGIGIGSRRCICN